MPGAIVEGALVTIVAGYLSSQGRLSLLVCWPVLVLGDLIGDSFFYSVGRWGSRTLLSRWGRYCGIGAARLDAVDAHFDRYAGRTLILGKMSLVVGPALLAAAGVARVSYGRFLWFNLVATVPKTLILLLLGFFFAQTSSEATDYFGYGSVVTLTLALCVIALYATYRKTQQRL